MDLSNPVSIHPRAPKPETLRIMNEAQGEIYWSATDTRWQNLLSARNNFTRKALQLEGYSPTQFKALPKVNQRFITYKIELAFIDEKNGFFQFTRDNYWMQDAVGDHGGWITIDGMARWHIRLALSSLESYPQQQLIPDPGSASRMPFDPVRDSARENASS